MAESKKGEITSDKLFSQLRPGIGKFVGMVGGGSLSFGALSFGIGYLAIKSHDAMLGLPTTTSNYESYVRTGALFFSNSLNYLITTITDYLWPEAFWGMLLALLILYLLSRLSLSSLSKHLWIGFVVAYVVISLLALQSAKMLTAALHPQNKDLLLKNPYEATHTGHERDIHKFLLEEEGEVSLQKIYSFHLGQTILFLCIAIALSAWRQQLKKTHSKNSKEQSKIYHHVFLGAYDWIFRLILYSLILFHVALLPQNYGILCLSNKYPPVQLIIKRSKDKISNQPRGKGYLLTDMSVDLKEIIWLKWDDDKEAFTHYFFEKREISEIELIKNPGLRNILAVMKASYKRE